MPEREEALAAKELRKAKAASAERLLPDANQAERKIQEEDPTPAEICGDGPTDRRSQHRRHQARQGDIGNEPYEITFFGRTRTASGPEGQNSSLSTYLCDVSCSSGMRILSS